MECLNRKIISTKDLFPIIREYLSFGRKVKFTVKGNSMLPWIVSNRDQVIITNTTGKKLNPGDIILFQNQAGRYLLHRIIRKELNGYRTMGDSCYFEDDRIYPEDIIGVVETIYRKNKEINCKSVFWITVFSIWCNLLPIRKQLLGIYFLLVRLKRNNIRLFRNKVVSKLD